MGGMEGFAPPVDKVIGQLSTDYFSFPKLRWSFCHFRQLQATRAVNRGLNPISKLSSSLDPMIEAVTFTPINAAAPMTWRASLEANYTDGIVVMHRGEIVYEYYSGCLDRAGRHGAMSVTKSFVGVIGEMLIAEGILDDQKPVGEYVPELNDSAFGSASLRQVMDMTTALDYNENYADPESDIWLYAAAGNPVPKQRAIQALVHFMSF